MNFFDGGNQGCGCGMFGGNNMWLLLLLCCCGNCSICDILPILLIMNCCCEKKCNSCD